MTALANSADLRGKRVTGLKDANLGEIFDLYVDLATGAVAFVVVQTHGLLGVSAKYQPVPWNALRYDAVSGAFRIEADKARFKAAPSYDREQLANPVYGWPDQVTQYFDTPAP